MVNEKRLNDWYKNASDQKIKGTLKRINNRLGWAIVAAICLFTLFLGSIGYYESELYLQHAALMESAKMNLFMAGAIGYCANQTNITARELLLGYSQTYIGSILDNNKTNEDCKYGCDNLKGAQI